ncbi:SpoIIE family protein phosphatase [Streptomyces sp. NPDC051636]|uniref:SpoIIE family protein phosphatase n=1 Tax=Streptomyces sp. NPDC051636 TaxID=3365663 RepID=UPI0037905398
MSGVEEAGGDTAAGEETAPGAEAAESPVFSAVAVPEITVRWNQELAPALRDAVTEHGSLEPAGLLDALPELWRTVDAALERVGPGCLVTESVRHDAYEGWQVAALPRYDLDGGIRPQDRRDVVVQGPPARDRRALVQALVDAVAERPCLDLRDALRMLDVFAGIFPHGLDAVCHRLLAHDLRLGAAAGLAPLHEALRRRAPGRISATCYQESAVGSRKAKGDPATDNEDAAGAARGASGAVRCAVFDGVTGSGDGSGALASRAALDQAGRRWRMDEDLPPQQLVDELDAAIGRATAEGSAAAVLATVRPDGTASLVSAGDAEAWLVRPLRGPASTARELPFAAWKLTPAHTGYAEQLRITPDAEGEESALVNYLGNGPGRWTHSTLALAPGDLLLLASDGATEPERDRWFGAVLAELAAQIDASGRPPAPALAAALVQRAEALGGWDNATALVCAIGEAKDA